jgi:hypothetical protein
MKKNILLITIFFLASCTRPTSSNNENQFKIVFPKKLSKQLSKTTSISAQGISLSEITYENLCFAVNVKSESTTLTSGNLCQVEQGIVVGSVDPGRSIEVTLKTSKTIDVEIYGFLRTQSTDPCPVIALGKWDWPVEKTFLLDSQKGIPVTSPVTDVNVSLLLPTSDKNVAVTNNWPLACLPDVIKPPSNSVTRGTLVSNANLQQSSKFRLYSRMVNKPDMKLLKGSRYEIKHW